jgi:hypothetical protein
MQEGFAFVVASIDKVDPFRGDLVEKLVFFFWGKRKRTGQRK